MDDSTKELVYANSTNWIHLPSSTSSAPSQFCEMKIGRKYDSKA